MIKIYIAGKWNDKKNIKKKIDELSYFTEITYDWTVNDEDNYNIDNKKAS